MLLSGVGAPVLLWNGCTGFIASFLHLLLVMFSVNINYKEITRFGVTRGEQYVVTTSRENVSWAWCELAAVFSKGAAVPLCDQLPSSGGKPIISLHSFFSVPAQFTNSSVSHLLKSTRTVCRAAALLRADKKAYRDRASSRECGAGGGFPVRRRGVQLCSPGGRGRPCFAGGLLGFGVFFSFFLNLCSESVRSRLRLW